MAWDAPRRVLGPDPLPRALGRPFLCVDEFDFVKSRKPSDASSLRSAMAAQLSPIVEENRVLTSDAPLKAIVTVTFHDSGVRSIYHRVYRSSQAFQPTDQLCQGLVRRIEHCSHELITRKDSDALNSYRHSSCKDQKARRFDLYFEITRAGVLWTQRSFTSYQKHSLTITSAREVMRSTHNMIGVFLKRHDKDFIWKDEPAHDHIPGRPETFIPTQTGPLNLTCIPRSLFIESTQSWEFVPGYTLQLHFKSNNPARKNSSVISRTLKIDSCQATPLNLGLGEDLLWQAYRCVEDVLDQKKNSFDLEHANCDGFDGVADCDCQHFDDDALSLDLRVTNNLGPAYEHLHRTIESRLRLFSHPQGQDCDDFVAKLSTRLQQFQESHDKKIAQLNDFDLRIAELTGHGWRENNCARFVMEGVRSHSRRSIEALLDRIRTGVADVLRGHDVAIRLIAYKRGHLVLDKGLIGRNHEPVLQPDSAILPKDQQTKLITQLKERIQKDIDMICKDTCIVEDASEAQTHAPAPGLQSIRPCTVPFQPVTPRSSKRPLRETSPGTPGSFKTRPPTPPEVPRRVSSLRAFPLVPAEFKEKQRIPSDASTTLDSAIGMEFDGDSRAHNDTAILESVAGVRVPPVILEDQRENTACGGHQAPGLQPAAEVYRTSRVAETDADTNSTHSSMPTLFDGDTPSPGHTMLMTPDYVRSASPAPRDLSLFRDDFDSQSVSVQSSMVPSVPNSTTFPDVERFEEPKFSESRHKLLAVSRPITPGFEKSVPVDTPKVLTSSSDDDKTPLAHRHMQGPTRSDSLQDPVVGLGSQFKGPDSSAEDELPAKDWLLSCEAEDVSSSGDAQCKSQEAAAVDIDMALAACDSTETLRPPPSQRYVSLDGVALSPIQGQRRDEVESNRDAQAGEDMEAGPTMPASCTTSQLKNIPVEDELCRSKMDFFELDEEDGVEPSLMEDHEFDVEDEAVKLSEDEDSDISHCGTLSDVEVSENRALSPINEGAFDFGIQPVLESSHEDVVKSQQLGETCVQEEAVQPAVENMTLPAIPMGKRTVSNPHRPSSYFGLGNGHLLPPLPIFARVNAAAHPSCTPRSTSSSWEDYVSSGRGSTDSVDTYKGSPSVSEEQSRPSTPKRLETPTAGLLGLHESCWAGLGIRSSLADADGFEVRPGTAPTPESAQRVRECDAKETKDPETTTASLSPPRKTIHLHQKRSVSSMLSPSRLGKKPSKELRRKGSKGIKYATRSVNDVAADALQRGGSKKTGQEGGGESSNPSGFRGTMMFVAGMVFASSIMSGGGQS